jgi:hypothetical protein
MQYTDLTTALGELMVVTITNPASATPSNDPNFNNILPNIINDAEQRIYRELDFLYTRSTAWEPNAFINQNLISIPSTTIVLQGANIITNLQPIESHEVPLFAPLSFTGGLNTVTLTDGSAPLSLAVGDFVDFVNAGESTADVIVQGPYAISQVTPSLQFTLPFNAPLSSTFTGHMTYSSNFSNLIVVGNLQTRAQNWPAGGLWDVGLPVTFTAGGYTLPAGSYPIITSSATTRSMTIQAPVVINSSENVNDSAGLNLQVQYIKNGVGGIRNRIEIVSKDALDILWPQGLGEQGPPRYAAFINNTTLMVGPSPDQNYIVEFTGTFRPIPMSAGNTTTYLGANYPELFLAACMVFGMAYQKDADLPANAPPGQDSTKWETLYQSRKASALSEAERQKYQGKNWSAYAPTPESTPRP